MIDMVDARSVEAASAAPAEPHPAPRRSIPNWAITVGSLIVLLGAWEIFGRDINPVFGSYPSAIAEAFWQLARTGKLWAALLEVKMKPPLRRRSRGCAEGDDYS